MKGGGVLELTNFRSWTPWLLRTIYFAIYSMLGVFSVVWLLSLTSHNFGADQEIYLRGYSDARAGNNPYDPYSIGTSFVNHPLVLVLARLLFVQDVFESKIIWSGVSITAWLISFVIAISFARLSSQKHSISQSSTLGSIWLLAAFLLFGPFLETIAIGQVNTIALLFVMAALVFSEGERSILAGIALSAAILLKTAPIIFLAYFLIIRRYRIVLVSIIGVLLLTMLSEIPFSATVTEQFIAIVPRLSNEIHQSPYSFSLTSVARRLFTNLQSQELIAKIPTASKIILGTLLVVLGWLGWRSPSTTQKQRIWLFACFQTLAVVFSSLVWYHHFVFLLFPLLLLLSQSRVAIQLIGIFSLSLLQVERYFEYYVDRSPWPAILSMAILLITVFVVFVRLRTKGEHPSIFPPNPSLDRTGNAAA